jgi:hypothetical protein
MWGIYGGLALTMVCVELGTAVASVDPSAAREDPSRSVGNPGSHERTFHHCRVRW